MRRWLLVAVIGCGGGTSNHIGGDGGTDADGDASVDASGDAACDTDGDGICDAVDVCPSVADPAQVDPDGDHIGWACDSVESIVAPNLPGYFFVDAELVEPTFAAALVTGCTAGQPCNSNRVVTAVSPAGLMIADQSSGLPQDAWLTNATFFGGPHVAASGSVFASNGLDTGSLDLVAGTFNVALPGVRIGERADGRRALEALVVRTNTAAQVAVPSGNALQVVAQFGPVQVTQRIATDSRLIGIHASNELGSYDAGTGWTSVGTFDDVRAITAIGGDTPQWPEIPYCVRTGTLVEYIGLRPGGVTRGTLPFSTCSQVTSYRSPHASDTLVMTGWDDTKFAGAFVRGTQVATIFENHDVSAVTVSGTTALQAVVSTNYGVTPAVTKVWLITSTGTVVPIPHSLQNVTVSAVGSTVHVTGSQHNNGAGGPATLIRYREATGIQTIALGNVQAATTTLRLQTSVEGAAIIAGDATSWIVPSTSTTPMTHNLDAFSFSGGAHGSTTMVFGHDRTEVAQNSSVYAYDELAGARLTRLTTDSSSTMGTSPLDELHTSGGPWFTYVWDDCHIARIVYTGTTPSLQREDCPRDAANANVGRRSNGDSVLLNYGFAVWIATATTLTKVAVHDWSAPSYVEAIVDRSTTPPVVVGWKGRDAMGYYACLASHPDRCWTIPAQSQLLSASAEGDGYFALMGYAQSGSNVTLTVVRTIDQGNRPQPL